MAIAALPQIADRTTLGRAVATLTLTQVIGWSTTFHVPAVLSARIATGTGLRPDLVFGGLTLMLLVAAVAAPRAGRLLERRGARQMMAAGSAIQALGLALLAAAHGPLLFGLAWMVIGAAMPLTLNQGSSTALVQISPAKARQTIAVLLMLSGLSAVIAWPSFLYLDREIGWRGTVLVCAALNLLVCLPLHLLGLPRRRVVAPSRPEAELRPGASPPTAGHRPVPGAFALAAISFSISGMITWGLPLLMIGMLRDFGHPEALAISLASLFAPAQVLARGFEMMGGRRLPILLIGVIATTLLPLSLAILLLFGTSAVGAAAYAVVYGIGAGLNSIVRAVAPLRLFGPKDYATILGRMSVPMNLAFAFAPIGFSVVRETLGGHALAAAALALSLVCVPLMTILHVRTRRDETAPARDPQPGR